MHIATFLGMKRVVFVLGQFYGVSTFMEKQSNIMYYMHLVENNLETALPFPPHQ